MSTYRSLAIETKFVENQNANFEFTWPSLPFTPDEYKVVSITYDDRTTVGAAPSGTVTISCDDLYGVIGSITSHVAAAGVSSPSTQTPGLKITNSSKTNLSRQTSRFYVRVGGSAVTTLNGNLCILLQLKQFKPKKDEQKF